MSDERTSELTVEEERLRRWRLILGGQRADGTGYKLSNTDSAIDRTLAALYDAKPGNRGLGTGSRGGSSASSPSVSRWLGDIRSYFPKSVVRVMQQDALKRLKCSHTAPIL